MTPTIIILKEFKDKGKTSTLRILRHLFLKDSLTKVVDYPIEFEDGDDFSIVFDFNNKRIGICSIGDPGYEEQFKKGFTFCKDKQCDIIVVAARPIMTYYHQPTPYGLVWDYINNECFQAFETSPYVTYMGQGEMCTDILNLQCAESLKRVITNLL